MKMSPNLWFRFAAFEILGVITILVPPNNTTGAIIFNCVIAVLMLVGIAVMLISVLFGKEIQKRAEEKNNR